ncbi:MAG TPA: hypothetical protein DIW47_03290 [Bacteroidetes bacterium]|nr:hypothetical protein [Bacteroidota bacterium]
MRKRRIFNQLLMLLFAGQLAAQDAIYSQFYASPMLTNPALAGVGLCGGRAGMQYRNQWTSIPGNFRTGSFAYDQVAPGIGGAFGVSILNDVAGDGLLTTTAVNLVYNYGINLNKHWTVFTALQGSYIQRGIDFSRLYFADQIEAKKGFVKPTQETLPFERVSLPSFSTGAVISGKGFYAGIAVFHLNEPSQSFYGNPGPGTYLPRRANIHAGMNIRVGNVRSIREKDQLTLSPNVLFAVQEKFMQMNLGFYASKGGLITGLWFRQTGANPDALIAIIGWQGKKYKVGYSYDVTVSQARAAVRGSHEVSFAYEFCLEKKVPKNWLNDICPGF